MKLGKLTLGCYICELPFEPLHHKSGNSLHTFPNHPSYHQWVYVMILSHRIHAGTTAKKKPVNHFTPKHKLFSDKHLVELHDLYFYEPIFLRTQEPCANYQTDRDLISNGLAGIRKHLYSTRTFFWKISRELWFSWPNLCVINCWYNFWLSGPSWLLLQWEQGHFLPPPFHRLLLTSVIIYHLPDRFCFSWTLMSNKKGVTTKKCGACT